MDQRVDAHFHAVYNFTYRGWLEDIPLSIRDKRSAFSHPITYRVTETDGTKKLFYLFIERSTAYYDFFEITTESLIKLIGYLFRTIVLITGRLSKTFIKGFSMIGKMRVRTIFSMMIGTARINRGRQVAKAFPITCGLGIRVMK